MDKIAFILSSYVHLFKTNKRIPNFGRNVTASSTLQVNNGRKSWVWQVKAQGEWLTFSEIFDLIGNQSTRTPQSNECLTMPQTHCNISQRNTNILWHSITFMNPCKFKLGRYFEVQLKWSQWGDEKLHGKVHPWMSQVKAFFLLVGWIVHFAAPIRKIQVSLQYQAIHADDEEEEHRPKPISTLSWKEWRDCWVVQLNVHSGKHRYC